MTGTASIWITKNAQVTFFLLNQKILKQNRDTKLIAKMLHLLCKSIILQRKRFIYTSPKGYFIWCRLLLRWCRFFSLVRLRRCSLKYFTTNYFTLLQTYRKGLLEQRNPQGGMNTQKPLTAIVILFIKVYRKRA